MRTLLTFFTLLSVSVVAASQTFDAEKSLKELDDWVASKLKSLESERTGPNASAIPFGDIMRAVESMRRQRALALIEKVPPETIPPKQSLAAAELYCYAHLTTNKVVAARRFLTTTPEPALRYRAQELLLQVYTSLSAAELQSVLREIKPPSAHQALELMDQTASSFSGVIAAQLSADPALETLGHVESLASLDALLKDEKEGVFAERAFVVLARARANLLSSLRRTNDAQRVIQDARSKVRRSASISTLERAAASLGLEGSPKAATSPAPK